MRHRTEQVVPESEQQAHSRRSFLQRLALLSGALAVASFCLGALRFVVPQRHNTMHNRIPIGRRADFVEGTMRDLPEHNARVFATAEGLCALSVVCTHLGCIVDQRGSEFFCPCHASAFDSRGVPTSGPAPRPLDWYKIGADRDGELYVDLDQIVPVGSYFAT